MGVAAMSAILAVLLRNAAAPARRAARRSTQLCRRAAGFPRQALLAAGLTAAVVAAPLASAPALAMGAPGQPKTGPGGADYAIAATDIEKKVFGEGNGRALAFFPMGAAAKPRPVVVFLHAPGAISPSWYGAWLEHLARRGNVVIYPLYEETVGAVPYDEMTGEALKGVRAALAGIAAMPDVKADVSGLSFLGHSGGAIIAANLAALSGRDELPPARLLFGAMPARGGAEKIFAPPLANLASIPPKAVAVMLVGDRDSVAGDRGARQILTAAGHLGQDHRLIARAGSDNHGLPAVFYSHHAAVAPNEEWDLAKIPGAAPASANPAAPGARPAAGKAAEGAPKLTPQEARQQREEQRKRNAALWRVGYEERRGLAGFEGRTVGAGNYAIWKIYDLAMDTVTAGGDAMTLKRDPKLYDMGLWSDGWPLRRLSVETPKPVVHKDAQEVSQGAPAAGGAPRGAR
ncbi:hypothetical protein GCM10019059_24680 [Camelimonas fluminis]|uniref:Alpha/beta hydrolase family protein n=1 Tax=Camelimonas fluminis TaxID=1576911 RepID=A0ABV7UC06_9HYPH|nr:hypothetical protein [Camelimonas fluminis]GHE64155.1 hypothetical protein GCM10019059_24680 [Camelimonas fluminis]